MVRKAKESIVFAYYTSEIGWLQELKDETNPFHLNFPGCGNPDERNWSRCFRRREIFRGKTILTAGKLY